MRSPCKLVTFVPIRQGRLEPAAMTRNTGCGSREGTGMLWIAIGYLGCWAVFVEVAYRSPTIEGVD